MCIDLELVSLKTLKTIFQSFHLSVYTDYTIPQVPALLSQATDGHRRNSSPASAYKLIIIVSEFIVRFNNQSSYRHTISSALVE